MQSVAVLRPHALLWRNPPVWPFLWRGLLPLAALALVAAFAVGPVAHDWIEGSVARETRSRLAAAGFSWVSVSASGQTVTLSGEEPAAGAGGRAVALARAVTCPSWIGRVSCAAAVVGRFAAPAPAASGSTAPVPRAAQLCDRSLAEALAGEQIEFGSGSAAIGTRSGALRDRLAREGRGGPGVLRVAGRHHPA